MRQNEFSPDDLSVDGCHRYLTNRFFVVKDLDPVSDTRKLQQLIAGIFRYTHRILNRPAGWDDWANNLEKEFDDQREDENEGDHHEEDSLGMFRLGRIKSLETLGTMVVVIGLY